MSLRSDITAEWVEFFNDMDPSGKNTKKLTEFFKTMNDAQFYKYAEEFFGNKKKNFHLAYEAYNNEVTIDLLYKVSKKQNIPIFEYVYKPYLNMDKKNPPGTAEQVMVIHIPIKRLKQMTQVKNHTTVNGTQRDSKTGQMTGHDKTARVTSVDAYSLCVHEQYSAMQEYYGPMSDNEEARYEMLRTIARDGQVSINDLPLNSGNTSVETVDYMFKGACIATNLTDASGHVLPITRKAREDRISTIKK